MPDNWGFVAAAYGLAALGLGGYWRYLRRRAREINSEGATSRARPVGATAPSETSARRDRAGKAGARNGKERA
jgi:hypothetical protein